MEIREAAIGERAAILAEVMACGASEQGYKRQRMFHMLLSDGSGVVTATWFKYQGDYLENKFHKGQKVIAVGKITEYKNDLVMNHPEVEVVGEEDDEELGPVGGIVPVYPLTEGVYQKTMRNITRQAVCGCVDKIPEVLPGWIMEKRELMPLAKALSEVHHPPDETDIDLFIEFKSKAHKRMVYEELFFLELGLALRRKGIVDETSGPG